MVEEENLREVSRIVQEYLTEKHLSLGEFEQQCGLTKSTLSSIVRGLHRPSPESLAALAKAMGYPENELLRLGGYLSGPGPEGDPEIADYAKYFYELPSDVQRVIRGIFHQEFGRLRPAAPTSDRQVTTRQGRLAAPSKRR